MGNKYINDQDRVFDPKLWGDCFKTAELLKDELDNFNVTQSDLAERYKTSQSTIANKIRLLRLPPCIIETIRKYDLSERHARALLKVKDPIEQLDILRTIMTKSLTVQDSERLVSKIIRKSFSKDSNQRDLRKEHHKLLTVTFKNTADKLKDKGLNIKVGKISKARYTDFVIRIMEEG